MSAPAIVLKFGSSVLNRQQDLPRAVGEIGRWVRSGRRVVAVVSAFAGQTDELLCRARALVGEPAPEGLAALLACGERQAAALLHLQLERSGLPAALADPAAVRLRVAGDLLTGEPRDLDRGALETLLGARRVLVLPGFFGVDGHGRIALLGRGGSDWTALFAARELGAACRLIKDTDGIFDRDPAAPGAPARPYLRLHFRDALEIGARVVQHGALCFAAAAGLPFTVAALGSERGTEVGDHPTVLGEAESGWIGNGAGSAAECEVEGETACAAGGRP